MKTTTISKQHLDWLLQHAIEDIFLCHGCPAFTIQCNHQFFDSSGDQAAYCLPRIRNALSKAARAVDLDAKPASGRPG